MNCETNKSDIKWSI